MPLERPDNFRFNIHSPLANGLVFAGLGYRGSDKTDHYRDSSLYGNHGTLTNMTPSTDWVWDSTLNRFALDMDGTNDFMTLTATHLAGSVEGNPWNMVLPINNTIAFWLRPDATANDDYIYGKSGDGGTQRCTKFDGSGHLGFYSGSAYVYTSAAMNDGKYHHVALAVRENGSYGQRGIYVDGVLSLAFTDLGSSASYYGTYQGIDGFGGNPNYGYYDGIFADPLVYTRILSAAEIQQLADPSNVMLSGLIAPPRRRLWAVPSGVPPTGNRRRRLLIGSHRAT